jgi:putative ATPase
MKKLGYGIQYKYAHDYPGHFVKQQYLPDDLTTLRLWEPADNQAEVTMAQRQKSRWS